MSHIESVLLGGGCANEFRRLCAVATMERLLEVALVAHRVSTGLATAIATDAAEDGMAFAPDTVRSARHIAS